MMVERGHHVVRVQRLAVVELDALAQGELPRRGVGSVDRLGQFGDQAAVLGDLRQVVPRGRVHRLHVEVEEGRRIQRIRGRPVPEAAAETPSLLRFRKGLVGECGRQRRRGTQRQCPLHKPATGHAALRRQFPQLLFEIHGSSPVLCVAAPSGHPRQLDSLITGEFRLSTPDRPHRVIDVGRMLDDARTGLQRNRSDSWSWGAYKAFVIGLARSIGRDQASTRPAPGVRLSARDRKTRRTGA